ncbi:protein CHUP1, chloroplastic [Morus notabilis]|uniref:protein CHUP1, chloroplastic n=1 Tax=Morus notabilis TaxID=981085 RepID=UPI000CED164E|nr:protein CHUP1, chloroplastic [Morus notabilis]
MKRRNKELELEKRELVVKLLAAQAKIPSLSHMTEGKIMSKLEDEISTLRCGNQELSKQIERFQKDRFTMVEELVYQRWLHSCLRFEIQNKENPRRETSEISLKNDPFQNFDEKNKSPSSYPSSSYSISSNISSSTETDQVESTTIGSSSSSQNSITSKTPNFMQRIKNFGRCKDDSSAAALLAEKRKKSKSRTGLIRRFSTSKVLVNSSPKPSCPRVRRVSFSDSVMTHNVPSSVESVLDQSASDENSSHNFSIGFEGKENSEEIKPDASLVSGGDSSDTSVKVVEGCSISEISVSKENKDEDHMAYLFVVLFFFLFIFLAYFLQITTRCHKA